MCVYIRLLLIIPQTLSLLTWSRPFFRFTQCLYVVVIFKGFWGAILFMSQGGKMTSSIKNQQAQWQWMTWYKVSFKLAHYVYCVGLGSGWALCGYCGSFHLRDAHIRSSSSIQREKTTVDRHKGCLCFHVRFCVDTVSEGGREGHRWKLRDWVG